MNSLFLDALQGKNKSRPPVWLMRQAGRYLPEYQKLRSAHSLGELFHTSDLAAEITLMPIKRFGFDAAIVFSDILVIAEALGFSLHFPEKGGPVIEPLLKTPQDIKSLSFDPEKLLHVAETIKKAKSQLKVPLIGFCGGPFTVASYLIEQGTKGELTDTKAWLYRDPESFHLLLNKITEASKFYLQMQIQAGVDAIQIFDSWAGLLAPDAFRTFSLPYLKELITPTPTLLFCRGSSLFAKDLASLNPAALSLDWLRAVSDVRLELPSLTLQGNLDPHFLKAPLPFIETTTRNLLLSMQGDPAFIVNLGHGVLPGTPLDAVERLVSTVQNFP